MYIQKHKQGWGPSKQSLRKGKTNKEEELIFLSPLLCSAPGQILSVDCCIQFSQELCEAVVIVPISQMEKQKPGEVE